MEPRFVGVCFGFEEFGEDGFGVGVSLAEECLQQGLDGWEAAELFGGGLEIEGVFCMAEGEVEDESGLLLGDHPHQILRSLLQQHVVVPFPCVIDIYIIIQRRKPAVS